MDYIVGTECYEFRGKRPPTVMRNILRKLMDDHLLAELTWGGVSRDTGSNGKCFNVALKTLKGFVQLISSKSYLYVSI